MGLQVNFDVKDLTQDLTNILNMYKKQDVTQAARRAINRSLLGVRQKAMDDIRKRINVKEKELRKRMVLNKAQGSSFETLEGSIGFSGEPFPLLMFVKGSKAAIRQKGIKIKSRRKLKLEIVKGKVFTSDKAFIQKVKTIQVFRRPKKVGFKKQGIRSLGYIVSNERLGKRLTEYGAMRFRKEFFHELEVRASGIVKSAGQGEAASYRRGKRR